MTYRLALVHGPHGEIVLTWDGPALVATAGDESVRVRPAALCFYRYDRKPVEGRKKKQITGVAALDADGLVLLDLPGAWRQEHVAGFCAAAGVPFDGGWLEPSDRVRARLSGRAPGWRRFPAAPARTRSRWRMPLIYAAGVVGLALMAYLVSVGAWAAWRGLTVAGRVIIDLVDVKWLAVAFSPLVLVFRPIRTRWRRYEARKGWRAGPLGGPNLVIEKKRTLAIHNGMEKLPTMTIGAAPGKAAGMLAYQYEDRTGLFILDGAGQALHHIPGPWSPEDLRRLTARHHLSLAAHRITREEYVNLIATCRHGSP